MAGGGGGKGKDWEPAPARGYSWPPFAKGHTLSLRHGAKSKRTLTPIVEVVRDATIEAAPWTANPAFESSLESYCWAEAELFLRRQALDEDGLDAVDDKGRVLQSWNRLQSVEGRARRLRAELGLSPMSNARMIATLTAALRGGKLPPPASDVLDLIRQAGRATLTGGDAKALPEPEDEGSAA